jgi:YidC/Oxa1 family membrane protein insertase
MNDIRRTILWVIFGFSMVLLWDKWQIHNGNKATFFPAPPAQTASAPATPALASAGASSVPVAAATPAQPPVDGVPAQPAATPRQRVTVSTDVLRLAFDS